MAIVIISARDHSNTIEKGEALADTETLVIGPTQLRGFAVLGAGFLRKLLRLVEPVHDPVIADRDVRFVPLNDLRRIASGDRGQDGEPDQRGQNLNWP